MASSDRGARRNRRASIGTSSALREPNARPPRRGAFADPELPRAAACPARRPPNGGGGNVHSGAREGRPRLVRDRLATTDGHGYEVGDSRAAFTIQSISKPFTYGLALQDRGLDAVDARSGSSRRGDAFNSISLAPDSGRPLNPMINAGAIASTSLVAGAGAGERLAAAARRLLALRRAPARGRRGGLRVGAGDRPPQPRDRPHAAQLRHPRRGPGRRRSTSTSASARCAVDCRDLALMAATLANGGVNP